ncbi:MAG TPA: hypothetical protein VIL36_10385, partial [Acidimicrobiales bacterium]
DPFVRCRYCDPDGLGVADRRREWERKRDDPLVRPYAELAEPSPEPPPDPGAGAGSSSGTGATGTSGRASGANPSTIAVVPA